MLAVMLGVDDPGARAALVAAPAAVVVAHVVDLEVYLEVAVVVEAGHGQGLVVYQGRDRGPGAGVAVEGSLF